MARTRRTAAPVAAIAAALVMAGGPAHAGDPDGGNSVEAPVKTRTWIRHTVLPGELLQDVADRYGVHRKSIIRWNKLDADRPRIRAGQRIKVRAEVLPPEREEVEYVVQFGDTWREIADAHGVSETELRRWNHRVPRQFQAGTKLRVWVEPEPEPALESQDSGHGVTRSGGGEAESPDELPLQPVSSHALSIGKPTRGRIYKSVQLPENDKLYSRLRPENAYASSHTIELLQRSIAKWRRDHGYRGALAIGALSKQGGGRLSPHKSHQSGRDVDIRLPLANGVPAGTKPEKISQVDWDATWALMKTLLDTGEITYIFLEHGRQKTLHRAAKRAGASKEWLEKVLQYPSSKGSGRAIIRHAAGHTSHMHVRFGCGDRETRCETH